MSAPQFREGDVVRDGDREERVVEGAGASGYIHVTCGMSSIWRAPDRLTLLRRPVRVGDTLRRKSDVQITSEVRYIREDGHVLGHLLCRPLEIVAAEWEHVDGTAIDPPAPEVKPTVTPVDGPPIVRDPELERAMGAASPVVVVRVPAAETLADQVRSLAPPWLRGLDMRRGSVARSLVDTVEAAVEKGLVRALWETDPEVIAFVKQVSEHDHRDDLEAMEVEAERCATIAWERREPAGSRERAEQRADAVLSVLRRSTGGAS